MTNQFYPLTPGTTYQYEGETPEGLETITIEVLDPNQDHQRRGGDQSSAIRPFWTAS